MGRRLCCILGVGVWLLLAALVESAGVNVQDSSSEQGNSGPSPQHLLEQRRHCDVCQTWMLELRRLLEDVYCTGKISPFHLIIPPTGFNPATSEAKLEREHTPADVAVSWVVSATPVSFVVQFSHSFLVQVAFSLRRQGKELQRLLRNDGHSQDWSQGHEGLAMFMWRSLDALPKWWRWSGVVGNSGSGVPQKQVSSDALSREEGDDDVLRGSDVGTNPLGPNATLLQFARRAALRVIARYSWDDSYGILLPRPQMARAYSDSSGSKESRVREDTERRNSAKRIRHVFAMQGLGKLVASTAAVARKLKRRSTLGQDGALTKLEAFLGLISHEVYNRRVSAGEVASWPSERRDACVRRWLPPLEVFLEEFCPFTSEAVADETRKRPNMGLDLISPPDISFGFCKAVPVEPTKGKPVDPTSSTSTRSGSAWMTEARSNFFADLLHERGRQYMGAHNHQLIPDA